MTCIQNIAFIVALLALLVIGWGVALIIDWRASIGTEEKWGG